MFADFTLLQLSAAALIFIWSGFVRSGLGFGGGALALPLMLLVHDQTIFWIPVIGIHMLFFSVLTLRTRLGNVDWPFLRESAPYIVPAAIAGVFGLINLPNTWLLVFIYSLTLFYAVLWVLDKSIQSRHDWVDKALLVLGGYVSGTSLTGAPLMVAVFMRRVAVSQLRNTMFVLWFVIVSIKLATLATFRVDLNVPVALVLIPVAAIGHFLGLKAHDLIMARDRLFRRVIGGFLIFVCLGGLWQIIA
ncbi:MAG: sulfite exporter TauE/SafE family protein [Pseudomonadales bacterium]|nr:sulfite exporter TauE/SafE family protein [Pseudomonadales bacterium]